MPFYQRLGDVPRKGHIQFRDNGTLLIEEVMGLEGFTGNESITIPISYHHSNLQSEEMIYCVSGNFGSRKGVEVGSITLHPSGLPHGPQPGFAEKSIGLHETHELAVMCDTFNPLKLSRFAQGLDDGKYWRSWCDNAETPGDVEDASGAGLTSHL